MQTVNESNIQALIASIQEKIDKARQQRLQEERTRATMAQIPNVEVPRG